MKGTPRLSHLQFLVLGVLLRGPLPGRDVRSGLEEFGVRKSGPAFYQLMARLEDAGFVAGSYHQEIVDGQIIRERHYEITGEGSRAWDDARSFYTRAIEDLGRGLAGA